jgi:hypothetical protein
MTSRCTALASALGLALALAAGGALADEIDAPEVEIPAPQESVDRIAEASLSAQPFSGAAAREDWQSRRPWGYGTQQLYPLTRGMEDAGIPTWLRWPLYPFTGLLDTGNLAFSAIGALYGD